MHQKCNKCKCKCTSKCRCESIPELCSVFKLGMKLRRSASLDHMVSLQDWRKERERERVNKINRVINEIRRNEERKGKVNINWNYREGH